MKGEKQERTNTIKTLRQT